MYTESNLISTRFGPRNGSLRSVQAYTGISTHDLKKTGCLRLGTPGMTLAGTKKFQKDNSNGGYRESKNDGFGGNAGGRGNIDGERGIFASATDGHAAGDKSSR